MKTKSLSMLADVPQNSRKLRPPNVRRAPQKLSPELAKRRSAKLVEKFLKPHKRKRPQSSPSSDSPQNSSPDITYSPNLTPDPSPRCTQASPINSTNIFEPPPLNSSPTTRTSPHQLSLTHNLSPQILDH